MWTNTDPASSSVSPGSVAAPLSPPIAEMQAAYLRSDPTYRGVFFLGVRTTGIFCHPDCSARKPLPQNVEYFPSPKEAMSAGYRPCKRCAPLAPEAAPPWVQALLDEMERDPAAKISESDLEARGIDPGRARRYFQAHYGMTFQAFARMRRLSGALGKLRSGDQIDDAVFESGYSSHSGFREAFERAFGLAPGRAKQTTSEDLCFMRVESPLGPLLAAATERGVCLLEFTDRRMLAAQLETLGRRVGGTPVPRQNGPLRQLQAELRAYFAGSLRRFTAPTFAPGTPFQERVWSALLEIPYGETRSYEELANAVGVPGGARAVGHANGMNRIAIVIPCHRVVNKDGALGGYGGGLRRKELLLGLERRGT